MSHRVCVAGASGRMGQMLIDAVRAADDCVLSGALDIAAYVIEHQLLMPDRFERTTGTIIAEGWHRGAGTAHAEVDALSQLTPEQAQGSTFVVTLEPCNHTGRTGPCAQALIEAGVGTVVYAATDPGHASSGGAQRLRDAGIEVIGGVLEDNVEELLEEWMLAARLHRPHVTVKWAASLDGRAAAHAA